MPRQIHFPAALLLGLSLMAAPSAHTGKTFSEWSTPVNLGAAVNSEFHEFLPALSPDGRSLYFSSNRPSPFGGEDIWVAHRRSRRHGWEAPVNLGPNINTSFNERSPALSRDGRDLFFSTNRPGGLGQFDIWVSRRTRQDDFSWQPPVNLGAAVNSSGGDVGPAWLVNGRHALPQLLFVSVRPGGMGGLDIYASERLPDGSFLPAFAVAELNSPQNDFRPAIRGDGLELYFDSNRPVPPGLPGTGARDLWVSTRAIRGGTWSSPVHAGTVLNTEFNDALPALSKDGRTLIITSDRPGGSGGDDLYVSMRRPERHDKGRRDANDDGDD
jgi:Tol biopolymer transport system component